MSRMQRRQRDFVESQRALGVCDDAVAVSRFCDVERASAGSPMSGGDGGCWQDPRRRRRRRGLGPMPARRAFAPLPLRLRCVSLLFVSLFLVSPLFVHVVCRACSFSLRVLGASWISPAVAQCGRPRLGLGARSLARARFPRRRPQMQMIRRLPDPNGFLENNFRCIGSRPRVREKGLGAGCSVTSAVYLGANAS